MPLGGPTDEIPNWDSSPSSTDYQIDTPQKPDGTPAQMPQDMAAGNETRPRIADPTARAEDDYYAAVNQVPQKMPRWKSTLKMLAVGLGRSQPGNEWSDVARQLGQGAGSALAGAIDPTLPNQIKKEYDIDRSYSRMRQIGTIENQKSLRASREASANYRTQRLAQFNSAAEEKKRFNEWRMKTGDRRADVYTDWIRWRKENGDQQQKTREDFNQWRQEAEQRVDADRDREYDRRVNQDKFRNELQEKQLELGRQREARLAAGAGGNADTSEEEVDFWASSADIYHNNAENAASSGNDEEEATYRALERSARIKSGEAASHGIRTRGKAGPATPKKDSLGLFSQ